jgi:hypothetical protein
MIRIKPLTLDDGTQILVEVEEAHIPAPAGTTPSDLSGATGADTMALLRASIAGLARSVHDSLDAESVGGHPRRNGPWSSASASRASISLSRWSSPAPPPAR